MSEQNKNENDTNKIELVQNKTKRSNRYESCNNAGYNRNRRNSQRITMYRWYLAPGGGGGGHLGI